ncbi:Eukaryotic aspartyl protease [Aphelenchoides bicaudatus]|nr:Eukaryotic aspartyl protease [Aphelenchoides bicaudatus]
MTGQKSSTYTEDGRPFEVEFASGKYAKDYVTIGEFVVKSQVFGVANLVANAMFEPIDGVLGIGWNADDSVPNILQGLDSTGLLSKSQLTLWLDKQPRLYPLPNNGLLTIGEIDNKNCKDWNVQPLNSDFYWQFNTDAFKVGKYSEKIQRTAIVSISELFILLGDAELNYVISETGAIFDDFYGAYVVPCKKIPTLPDLIFTINSVDYTVTAYDYVGLIALPGEDLCQLLVNESDDEFFFDTVVFGQPFLRPYCHSFNWKDHTIGLATALRN